MKWSGEVSAFSIFGPLRLPSEEQDSSMYGSEQLNTLTSYGIPRTISLESTTRTSTPDVVPEQTQAEWNCFDD